jgi:HEAT repeat protein
VEAAMALARLGDLAGLPVLVSALEEDILSDAPLTAAKYLAQLGNLRGFGLVQQALQHPLEGVRLHAAVALKYFLPHHGQVAGGQVLDLVEVVQSGLQDPQPQVRGELLYKLAGLQDERVGPLLETLAAADPDEDVRQAAQMLLQERAQSKEA